MSPTDVQPPAAPSEAMPGPGAEAAARPAAGEAPAAQGEAPVVVRVDNLGKRFKIYRRPLDRVREWILGGKHHTEFWAVRGVSLEVRRGECMGIIGANGSGKSTLLKMIAGALQPTEGRFEVHGRVLSLIELGAGLNPQLTGRANIIHAATLLGFPANYAREKIREIRDFAELGDFFDRPVILYSSGMRVRLAFSMFACFRPELFIVDEALSVGDVFFQQKCAGRIRELLDGGMTMLFVSHDQSAILNLCDRGMVLSKGAPIFYGEPEEAVLRYIASLRHDGKVKSKWTRRTTTSAATSEQGTEDTTATTQLNGAAPAREDGPLPPPTGGPGQQIIARDVIGARRKRRHGNGKATIRACRVTNTEGRDTMRALMGETLTFHVLIEAQEEVQAPRAGIRFFDRFNNQIFGAGTYQHGHALPPLNPGDRLIVRFDVTMDVAPGEYTFGLGTSEPATDSPHAGVAMDRIDLLGPLTVGNAADGLRPFYGAARLPMNVMHKPLAPRKNRLDDGQPTTEH